MAKTREFREKGGARTCGGKDKENARAHNPPTTHNQLSTSSSSTGPPHSHSYCARLTSCSYTHACNMMNGSTSSRKKIAAVAAPVKGKRRGSGMFCWLICSCPCPADVNTSPTSPPPPPPHSSSSSPSHSSDRTDRGGGKCEKSGFKHRLLLCRERACVTVVQQ